MIEECVRRAWFRVLRSLVSATVAVGAVSVLLLLSPCGCGDNF